MYPNPSEIDRILEESGNPARALRGLYDAFRAQNRKYSIAYFCRKLSIPSKGYFFFMMAGNRGIPERHWESIYDAFHLNATQRSLLQSLLSAEEAEAKRLNMYRARHL